MRKSSQNGFRATRLLERSRQGQPRAKNFVKYRFLTKHNSRRPYPGNLHGGYKSLLRIAFRARKWSL